MTPGEAAAYAADYQSAAASLDTWKSSQTLATGELLRMARMAARRMHAEEPREDASREELTGVLLEEMFPQIGDALAVLATSGGEEPCG